MIQLPIYVSQTAGCYGVAIPDLPGCHTSSLTAIGAIKAAETTAINFLNLAIEHNELLPPYVQQDHSKNSQYTGGAWYNIAVPRSLFDKATKPPLDETEYLLSSEANKARLLESVAQVSSGNTTNHELIVQPAEETALDGLDAGVDDLAKAAEDVLDAEPPEALMQRDPAMTQAQILRMLKDAGIPVRYQTPKVGKPAGKTEAKKKRKAQKQARKANR